MLTLKNHSRSLKILSLILSSAALFAFSSCRSDNKNQLEEKNENSVVKASENVSRIDESSEASKAVSDLTSSDTSVKEETSAEEAIQKAGIGGKIRSGKLDITLKSLYTTEYIKTGEETNQTAGEGKTYVVAELELENMYMSPAEIWCVENMIPSIDGESIDLSKSIHAFPRTLNGEDNLVEMKMFTIDTDSKVSGFIAFIADRDFKKGEIACCTDSKVDGIFEFENKPADVSDDEQNSTEESRDTSTEESSDTSEEQSSDDGKARTKELEIELESIEKISADEYPLPEAEEGMMYIRYKLKVTNISDEVYPFTINDFNVIYEDRRMYSFISSAYNQKITPGSSHECSVIFCVDKDMPEYTLCYVERLSNNVPTKLFTNEIR